MNGEVRPTADLPRQLKVPPLARPAVLRIDHERYEAIRSLAAWMMVTHSDANFVRVKRLFAEQTGCATPKVDVRGAVIEDGRILLVREIADSGRWTITGRVGRRKSVAERERHPGAARGSRPRD
jgi:hypothetical protein